MKKHSDVVVCPRCGAAGTLALQPGVMTMDYVVCEACGYPLPVVSGIPDFAESLTREEGTSRLKQRIMETRLFASLYETPLWRPLHTYVASGMTVAEEQAALLELAGGSPKEVVVDMACGTGHFARAFAREWPDAALYGLDLSLNMLRKAQRLAVREGVRNVVFARGSIFELPFADESVDMVNCCGALHLFQDQIAIWREVARVLRPGGVFTAEAVARDERAARIQDMVSAHKGFRFLDPDVLQRELEDAGLVDLVYSKHKVIIIFRALKRESQG